MSLFLRRISKLSAGREKPRFFSSLPKFPCLLLDREETLQKSPEHHKLLDATKEEICSSEKKAPNDLHMGHLIGASQGWFLAQNTKDDTLLLTDLYKPWVSSPRVISLPSPGVISSLWFLSHCTKVSLSSPDPVLEDDFSVAANFNDNQLSVCKPYRDDSTWTHIEVPHSVNLMYSKRDETFYFTAYEGLFNLTNNNKLKYKALRLRNKPQMSNEDYRDMLEECYRTEHLVESPSGELFFIKWYTKTHYVYEVCGSYKIRHIRPQRFMVFREKEKRSNDFCYTEDIGDLCVFLSKSEAFCLSASMYPGLKPNSIYYAGPNSPSRIFKPVGLYDLASGTIRSFRPCDRTKFSDARYWLHPTNPKGTENGTYVASCSDIDDSYLHRFQSIQALRVQDLIKPELCEETWNEFRLLGERKVTKAMEPGQGREEVVEKVTKELMEGINEEEVVEKVTKKFSKLEELEEEVNEKVTKTFSYSGELEEVVAKKVTKKFRGNKELEEEVVENITRTFSKFEELEEETAEKVTQKFRGKEELEEELVEKIKKIFSEMEITEEVVEKVTKKFRKLKKYSEQEITEVAEKVTKVFLSTPDDDALDVFFDDLMDMY